MQCGFCFDTAVLDEEEVVIKHWLISTVIGVIMAAAVGYLTHRYDDTVAWMLLTAGIVSYVVAEKIVFLMWFEEEK